MRCMGKYGIGCMFKMFLVAWPSIGLQCSTQTYAG